MAETVGPSTESKHRSAGSITLVPSPSPQSSFESFKSSKSFKSLPSFKQLSTDAIQERVEGYQLQDTVSVISQTRIDPILRETPTFDGYGYEDVIETLQQQQVEASRSNSTRSKSIRRDPNIVNFSGNDDPANPQNFPFRRKAIITFILAGLTFSTTFTSSIFSTSVDSTSNLFSLSSTVMTLGTALFLLGFTTGPIIWGPISELYGRKTPLIIGVGGMSLFQVGVATAQNPYTIFLCRFFGGMFGVSPLCVVGGALADFWDPVQRGVAVGFYSMCTFVGPVAAPIMGGYVTESRLGWRWSHYFGIMLSLLFWTVALIFLPETSHPRLLQLRARDLRYETGNWALHAPADEKLITARIIVERYLTRPFRMIHQEPILASLCLYIGLTYGILYLFLTAYPYSFHTKRGWSAGDAGLPFLAISIGVILGGILNSYWSTTQFRKRLNAAQNNAAAQSGTNEKGVTEGGNEKSSSAPIAPEARLPPMLIGGLLLPPGLFLFAWTSSPSIHPAPQILSGVPMGAGIVLILVNGLNYIVDVYKVNANSAIAANTVIRCSFGAVFPMFAQVMYEKLGVDGATSVLGGLAVLLGIGPFVFWRFGERIRGKSKFVLEE